MSEQPIDVALIGVGRMGGPMARNLRRAGFSVVAYDTQPSSVAAFAPDGVAAARSAGEAARQAQVIITMLPSDTALQQVLVDMGTSKLATSQRLAALVAERGAVMLDAPVSGGERGAHDGTLSIMVGGPLEVFERCRPLFGALGARVTHIGGNGMGLVAKLVNQMLMEATFCAAAEALVLAAKAGANLDAVYAAVSGGLGGSRVLDQLYQQVRAGDLGSGRELTLHHKDGSYALAAAESLGVWAPVTELTHALIDAALTAGYGAQSAAAVVRVFEQRAGIQLIHDHHEGS